MGRSSGLGCNAWAMSVVGGLWLQHVCFVLVVARRVCQWAVHAAAGLHPTAISEAFQRAADKAVEVLRGMSISVDLSQRDALLQSASTSLSSKVGGYTLMGGTSLGVMLLSCDSSSCHVTPHPVM